jgi:hypothetical protein
MGVTSWDLGALRVPLIMVSDRSDLYNLVYTPFRGVWEWSFFKVLEEYCSILKNRSIIYQKVFGKTTKISVFKTKVLQILHLFWSILNLGLYISFLCKTQRAHLSRVQKKYFASKHLYVFNTVVF